ncbi:T9SS type A sorting domain-containing protein [Flavobacteriaceae bacterium]|jgi:hypothetical protein|nr:T9SS type A sorting domain-containing protein [Flavobacteriaceae bacterium]
MKNYYFFTFFTLIFVSSGAIAQDELILNQSFDTDALNWTPVNQPTSPVSGWDENINHSDLATSGSFRLSEDTGANAHIKHDQFSIPTMRAVGGAGDYVISFWIYGAQGNRVKVQVANGSGNTVNALFTENLALNGGVPQPEITAIQTANTWQLVTTTVTLIDSWATLKIFNVKNGTTIYIDDISFRRSVSEMPVSDNLSTGWYPNNATSSIAASTGVHTLNMDNNNPQLKSWDYTIDADLNKFITISLKNNSENDALTIFYDKADGSGIKYVNTQISTLDETVSTYEINMTDTQWANTIYPLTLYIRKSNPSGTNPAYISAINEGDVEFHNIALSTTASIVENYSSNFIVYPNPADNILNLQSNIDLIEIQINNLLGQKIIRKTDNFETINVSNLSKGMYIITMKTINGQSTSKRFLKK